MTVQVELLSHTPDPELAVAIAARACVSDQDVGSIAARLSPADVERLIATTFAKGHHSVFEHPSFTFAISGVSRVLTHQLVRHRIASYSQLSQQRVDASDLGFVVPPEIRKDPELAAKYVDAMRASQRLYGELVDRRIPIGSARYVLPSAFHTRIVVTMNARSLFNLIEQRACGAEEWEFRQLATMIHRRLVEVAPLIFKWAGPKCETDDYCPEGEVGLACSRLAHTGASVFNTRADIAMTIASDG